MIKNCLSVACAFTLLSVAPALGQANAPRPTLYTVLYAHLDTQWLWEYPTSIEEYLPATMRENFALIERYPGYIFNFTGANRYRLMKEYYPAEYEQLRAYVARGRWFPAGSSMEEGDVNVPSAEAILRQILYGSAFFRREFGTASIEYFLPDSFGFPWSLPTLLAHAGIKGFSTAKLTWGSSVPDGPSTPSGFEGKGIPFNLGTWVGPDGRGIVAALNPGDYIKHISVDLSQPTAIDSSGTPPRPWLDRLAENQRKLGLPFDFQYVGTGDLGGSPNEGTISWLMRAAANRNGAIRIMAGPSDQLFRDLTPEQAARLPRYAGEMELTNHSAGSLTSQAYQKRWIRRNEVLADAAERISIAAELLGVRRYPMERLRNAWTLMLAGHFHDIAAGTSTPEAHSLSWNDAIIAGNQLSQVITDGSSAIGAALDTRAVGIPLVVYNALDIAREDVVEATVDFPSGVPAGIRVIGPSGQSVPAQLEKVAPNRARVVFLARIPSMGYAVYDVRAIATPDHSASTLRVDAGSLENARYRVRLNSRGDIASVHDKLLGRELLAAPIRLAIKGDTPAEFPAWNMDWADAKKPPRAFVGTAGTPRVTVAERGPARVALTIERRLGSSRFAQTVRLAAGEAGSRIEIQNAIDWRGSNATLKVLFPTTATNDSATYNMQVGTITRGVASERKFEVPSHQWIDLSDSTGGHGITLLTGDKRGSDRPDRSTIGLTLLRTPGLSDGGRFYPHQATQDWGHHEIVYGIGGHAGDWRAAGTDWHALRLDTPLLVFRTTSHEGRLGRTTSLASSSSPRVRIMALKKAEEGDEYIVRVVELDGRSQSDVRLTFATAIRSAREVDGQEKQVDAPVSTSGATISTDLGAYQIRSFAITLEPTGRDASPSFEAVQLEPNLVTASRDGERSTGGFDGRGRALPAEMLPSRIPLGGIEFALTGGKNAIAAAGQTVKLPSGSYNRLYLLAASNEGDQPATFMVGEKAISVTIQDWSGLVGSWDTRRWRKVPLPAKQAAFWKKVGEQASAQFEGEVAEVRAVGGDTTMALESVARSKRLLARQLGNLDRRFAGLMPGFVKRAPIAWYASHRHSAAGANLAYQYSYLFAYMLEVPPGTRSVTLPSNPRIRILAMTVGDGEPSLVPAWPLFDPLESKVP